MSYFTEFCHSMSAHEGFYQNTKQHTTLSPLFRVYPTYQIKLQLVFYCAPPISSEII